MQCKTQILNIFVDLYITIEITISMNLQRNNRSIIRISILQSDINPDHYQKPIWWGLQINFEQRAWRNLGGIAIKGAMLAI